MMKTTLTEFEARDVRLSSETAAHLQRHFSKQVELVPRAAGVWRLAAKQYVGTIVAPALELRVRPKCRIQNLFHLLARAYRLANLHRELIGHAEVDDLRSLLLQILVRRVEDLLRLGLRREYVEREEDLPVLRGRLRLDPLLRRPQHASLHLPCRFDDFTADVEANQILRYTLTRVGSAVDPALEARRRRVLRSLGAVSFKPFRARDVQAFHYTRLNAHYEPLHQLCRLLLDALGLEHDVGPTALPSFLIDMNAVFELFVASWIREHLSYPYALVTQGTLHLDLTRRIPIRPDLRLQRSGRDVLVADTKYKLLSSTTPSSADAYQALAYCRALSLQTCILIYPAEREAPEGSFRIRGGERVVTNLVPLYGTVEGIEEGMRRLHRRCLALAAEASGGGRRLASVGLV